MKRPKQSCERKIGLINKDLEKKYVRNTGNAFNTILTTKFVTPLLLQQKIRTILLFLFSEQKKKDKLKNQEDEELDDFSSGEESEGPDLSWLPDPDKIYGEKEDSDSGSDFSADDKDPATK